MNLQELSVHVAREFERTFGRPPRWIATAPGRVNVIGEHTDYNDGFVLPMAIEYYAVMAADRPPHGGAMLHIRSTAETEAADIDTSKAITTSPLKWSNYPRGVLAGFAARGFNPGGLDVLLHSTIPMGGGLSSSAALEVCTATLIEAVVGKKIDPIEKALLCQKAEHEFAGVPCGIMDQFISVMGREGHLLLLDCRSRKTELVPMCDPSVQLLIANTNVKHELGRGQYARRRAQCEAAAKILGVPSLRDASAEALEKNKSNMDGEVFRRARHVIGEIARTMQAAEAIRAAHWQATGELMYASHRSLRDDYEVSCTELDALVEIAESIGLSGGVYGCRMTGGGFGGCVVALVKSDSVAAITKKLAADYKEKTGLETTIFGSRPAAGAMGVQGLTAISFHGGEAGRLASNSAKRRFSYSPANFPAKNLSRPCSKSSFHDSSSRLGTMGKNSTLLALAAL
jgi:galactokinase